MEKTRLRWAVALMMVSAIACRSTTVVRKIEGYSPRTWVGADVSAVETVWGAAKPGVSDGLGGRIISYRGASAVTMSVSGPENLPDPGDDRDRQGKSERDLLAEATAPQGNNDTHVDAKFWVDGSGKVYRYWFSEQVWNKSAEKTAPPAEPVSGETEQH